MQVYKLALNPTHHVKKSVSNTLETANARVSVTAHTDKAQGDNHTHLVNPSANDDDITSSDPQHLLGCVVGLPQTVAPS